jgi:hypothetical protein
MKMTEAQLKEIWQGQTARATPRRAECLSEEQFVRAVTGEMGQQRQTGLARTEVAKGSRKQSEPDARAPDVPRRTIPDQAPRPARWQTGTRGGLPCVDQLSIEGWYSYARTQQCGHADHRRRRPRAEAVVAPGLPGCLRAGRRPGHR